MQGLIGLIGGYVGLVLGCSFLQLPYMVSILVKLVKRKSNEIKRTRNYKVNDEVIMTTS